MSNPPPASETLHDTLGSIDVYLLDQILKGRLEQRRRVLDVGCGGGRNLHYLLRQGFEVHACDRDSQSVIKTQRLARRLAGEDAAARIQVADARKLPYPAARFDLLIINAVLHFAEDEAEFDAIVAECGRVLAPGGLFFARLCSTIGLEHRVRRIQGRWHDLPDGSQRFLVDRPMLAAATSALGGRLADPIKTTLVEDLRAMTTWVVIKDGAALSGSGAEGCD